MPDDLTLDRKEVLPSKVLSIAGHGGDKTPPTPARRARRSGASPAKPSATSPASHSSSVAVGKSAADAAPSSHSQVMCVAEEESLEEDILTAIVTPHSTSIIVTLPSSSSPSPTYPIKDIKIPNGDTNSTSPNTLSVLARVDGRQRVAVDHSSGARDKTPARGTESKNISPKKLSFVAPPDVSHENNKHRTHQHKSNLSFAQSKSQPSLHTSSLRSSSYSLYSPYANRSSFPAVHSSQSKVVKISPNTPVTKHHSFSSVVSYNPQSNSHISLKKHSVPVTYSSTVSSSTKSRKKSSSTGKISTNIRKHHSFCSSSYTSLQHSSYSGLSKYSFSSGSSSRGYTPGHRSNPVSPKRKASSVYTAVSSCVCCRVRSQEGSGLTIRIPRSPSDRGSSPPTSSPPPLPRYAQLTTSRYAHMTSLLQGAPVPKSKSLSTSMDKISSRGSTPSSGRSSVVTRTPSRRSLAAVSLHHRPAHPGDGGAEKTDSPCGSETSLNSGISSGTSVKSLPSVRSSSSASNKSNCSELRAPVTTGRATPAAVVAVPVATRFSTTSSFRSSRSCTPPDGGVISSAKQQQPSAVGNGSITTKDSKSPVVATHRKNAVAGRPPNVPQNVPPNVPPNVPSIGPHTDSPKRRTPSALSASSSTTNFSALPPATGTRRMAASSSSNMQAPAGASDTPKKEMPVFNSYMSLFQVQEKLKKGEVIEGVLRINPKNYEDAYISAPGGGTDIYIGGVRDRNAALHGDLVAIQLHQPQYWKVLYEQLDYFLDCEQTLKDLVYNKDDPFTVMDQFVPPDSVAPNNKQRQDKEDQLPLANTRDNPPANTATTETTVTSTTTTTTTNPTDSNQQTGSSITESVSSSSSTTAAAAAALASKRKKNKRRRGKKSNKKKNGDEEEEMEEEDVNNARAAAEEVVAGLLANPPIQNVEDKLVILSCSDPPPTTAVAAGKDTSSAGGGNGGQPSKKKAPVVVVPPHMLSECSDITDDESVCSDSLDLDTAIEDRNFFNAQRAAARRAEKAAAAAAAGASVVFVTQQDGSSLAMYPAAKIVELPEDVEQSVGAPAIVQGESGKQEQPRLPDAAEKVEPATALPADKKKKVTVVERLFGDELKKQNKNIPKHNSKSGNDESTNEVENMVADMGLKKDSKTSKDQPIKVNEGDVLPSKTECKEVKTEATVGSAFDTAPVALGSHATPRFMVSPYNQQVNFSGGQSRAENNLINHPMLNNFSNQPNMQQHMQQQQQPMQQQQRQHKQNFNKSNNSQNQQRRPPNQSSSGRQENESRTVPSVAQVMRLTNWSKFVQKVAFVVHILDPRNTRLAAGTLKPFADMNRNFALFSPNDNRIPRMKIPMQQCPPDLFPRRNDYAKKIYLAKVVRWNDPKFAMGELVRDIGRHGDIDAESEAFLLQIGISYEEFPEEVTQELPRLPKTGWTVPEEAMAGRRDFRDSCIFSIDPASARDLDDAMSCEPLPGGRYRVGVHIADVSYFVPHGTKLDEFAASRATSVYLVDRVIPMLPRTLCEELCSLNPDEDRLAFSVVWEMDRYGVICSSWFGRSIIRSCAKLSYNHAQSVIDNPGKVDFGAEEMPKISRFPLSKVCETITTLQMLAVQMRARRHSNGALRLDQKKLSFNLDEQTKMPNAVQTTEQRQSNSLIEEFMLLANISVAHKIHESFPDYAVLRCHPEPQEGPLDDAISLLRTFNIEIDTSSAGAIYASLINLIREDDFIKDRIEVIVNMLSKPMQNALYFCSGTWQEDFSHYALNVPFYTHFTSPIRRYPDIMVHRLLAAAIDLERDPLPHQNLDDIDRKLSVCNEKKMSAKRASEHSCDLFLAEFVRRCREIHTEGIIIGVLDRALDVLLLDYCTIKRAYLEKLPLEELNFDNRNKNNPPTVHVVWSPDHMKQLPSIAQTFTYFTQVKVVLTPFTNDQLKFNVTILRPDS